MNKSLSEHGDKIDAAVKAEVETALSEAKAVDSSADLETLKAKVIALNFLNMS